MRALVFDTSSIISLVLNNLLWALRPLKKEFKGDFIISEAVKREVIDKPINDKRFMFEALTIKDMMNEGYLDLIKNLNIEDKSNYLVDIANHIFKANNNYVTIVQHAEVECVVIAKYINADACVVDERTLRLLIEDPNKLAEILGNKLHAHIEINQENLNIFKEDSKDVKVIRSTEIAIAAYELGILDRYITNEGVHPELKKTLLEGALWGLKLRGCSISENEINDALRFYGLLKN